MKKENAFIDFRFLNSTLALTACSIPRTKPPLFFISLFDFNVTFCFFYSSLVNIENVYMPFSVISLHLCTFYILMLMIKAFFSANFTVLRMMGWLCLSLSRVFGKGTERNIEDIKMVFLKNDYWRIF